MFSSKLTNTTRVDEYPQLDEALMSIKMLRLYHVEPLTRRFQAVHGVFAIKSYLAECRKILKGKVDNLYR